ETLGFLKTSPENHVSFFLSTPLRLAQAAGPQGWFGAGDCGIRQRGSPVPDVLNFMWMNQ
ncbi:MAG TPA: hypothetical protein VFB76_08130, partial [Candidatus Angelobacter sp.]|nr:hypothetical protein [Candidatus Angelobacter sp.]